MYLYSCRNQDDHCFQLGFHFHTLIFGHVYHNNRAEPLLHRMEDIDQRDIRSYRRAYHILKAPHIFFHRIAPEMNSRYQYTLLGTCRYRRNKMLQEPLHYTVGKVLGGMVYEEQT